MVKPCSHGLLGLAPHGAVNVCFNEEGHELWYALSFDRVHIRCMECNTSNVVYDGRKEGFV